MGVQEKRIPNREVCTIKTSLGDFFTVHAMFANVVTALVAQETFTAFLVQSVWDMDGFGRMGHAYYVPADGRVLVTCKHVVSVERGPSS